MAKPRVEKGDYSHKKEEKQAVAVPVQDEVPQAGSQAKHARDDPDDFQDPVCPTGCHRYRLWR